MTITLKIDNREGSLIEKLNELGISFTHENLAHGDIQILQDNNVKFLFERKTISDLLASIKDGRYKNQKLTLLQSGFVSEQMYYIIEGKLNYDSNTKNAKDKSCLSAMINTMLRDKISVFRTSSLNETLELILSIYNRISDDPSKYFDPKQETERQQVTLSINEKTTPDVCFVNQLCQIPHVSVKGAKSIRERYGSMKNFIKQCGDMDEKMLEKELSSIKTVDDNGKQRKIGSNAITSIIDYLFK